mgnify:CR=1 FL=1
MKLDRKIPIIIATTNINKVKEYQEIFRGFTLMSLKDISFDKDVEENGKTFDENSFIKAEEVFQYLKTKKFNAYVLSDDSGLVIKSLHGEPGIFSARYSGKNATYQTNRDLVLEKLKDKKLNCQRVAYLTTHICFITPNHKVIFKNGKTWGRITKTEIGDKTFGYNCIFYSYVLKKTFGEANIAELKINHRFKAARKILKLFK